LGQPTLEETTVLVNFQISQGVGNGVEVTMEREGDERPFSMWVTPKQQGQLRDFLRPDDGE
jgi:hypothetical protein